MWQRLIPQHVAKARLLVVVMGETHLRSVSTIIIIWLLAGCQSHSLILACVFVTLLE